MNNPYAISNFRIMRESKSFYIDKTRFIPMLEDPTIGTRYPVFLRPRRFGKSLFLSTLEHYYDLARADQFDALFGGLYVHEHPTPLRNSFLALRLDFSSTDASRGLEPLFATFASGIREKVRSFLARYRHLGPDFEALRQRLNDIHEPVELMQALVAVAEQAGYPLYVLIDEYDSFTNDILARGDHKLYDETISQGGFFRGFFKALKDATAWGVLNRMFVTGVSPVTLDDLASGFNIGTQVTHQARFAEMCGLNRAEVELAVDAFMTVTPHLASRGHLLRDLGRYYDGYRFWEHAKEGLYNPDMVFYYLMQLRVTEGPPKQILDMNVRVDLSKLRMITNPPAGSQDWHLEVLEPLLAGEVATGTLIDQFGATEIHDQQHFLSLLYCMGLVTHAGTVKGQTGFRIPNFVIRTLHWEAIARILRERANVVVDTLAAQDAVSKLAYDGNPQPFLDLMQDKVLKHLSRRDFRRFDERFLKVILLSYLSLSTIYHPLSETELQQDYCDMFLTLDRRYPDATYAWLLELKYCKTRARQEEIAAKQEEAATQIRRYLADPGIVPLVKGDRTLRAASVVVVGTKAIHWELVEELA